MIVFFLLVFFAGTVVFIISNERSNLKNSSATYRTLRNYDTFRCGFCKNNSCAKSLLPYIVNATNDSSRKILSYINGHILYTYLFLFNDDDEIFDIFASNFKYREQIGLEKVCETLFEGKSCGNLDVIEILELSIFVNSPSMYKNKNWLNKTLQDLKEKCL